MSQTHPESRRRIDPYLVLFFLMAGAFYATGLPWGTPNQSRADLILTDDLKNDAFYQKLAQNRQQKLYNVPKGHLIAAIGEKHAQGRTPEDPLEKGGTRDLLLFSYSSYLIRTLDSDEHVIFVYLSSLNPAQGKWIVQPGYYGGFFLYTIAAMLKAAQVAGWVQLVPDISFYYKNPEQMGRMFIMARLLSLIAGLIALLLVYVIANVLFSQAAARWAAFFWVCSPLIITFAHVAKPHLFATVLALANLYCCLRLLNNPSPFYYVLGALSAGLAMGSSYTTAPLALALPLAHAWLHLKNKTGWRFVFDKKLCLYVGLALLIFALTNPSVLFNFKEWYYSTLAVRDMLPRYSSWSPLVWLHAWLNSPMPSLGPATFALFIAGAWAVIRKDAAPQKFFLAFWALYLLWWTINFSQAAAGDATLSRYCMSAMAMMAIVAGRGLTYLKEKTPPKIASILMLLCGFYPMAQALYYVNNYGLDTEKTATYMQAGRWINENIPKNASIGIWQSRKFPQIDYLPPFKFYDFALEGDHDKIVAPDHLPQYFLHYINQIWAHPFDLKPAPILPFPDFLKYYEPIKIFEQKTWPWLNLRNIFSAANYPVYIYKRKE